MKKSLLLLVFIYLGLVIGAQGQTAPDDKLIIKLPSPEVGQTTTRQTTDDLVWRGGDTTIQVPESSSKIIMSCSGVPGEELKVTGCELVNGGTLDDVVNNFLQASQAQQERYDILYERFSRYIKTVDAIFETLRNKQVARKVKRKSLPPCPPGKVCGSWPGMVGAK